MTEYFLGIDGGGSSCKARLEDQHGTLLASAVSGPANISHRLDRSVSAIAHVTRQVISLAGLSENVVTNIHTGIGLAGIGKVDIHGLSGKKYLVQQALAKKGLSFQTFILTNDLYIACYGAHHGKNGSVVIIGTGSSAISLHDNKGEIKGGHGFLLGDQGSGAWLGKQAVSLVLLELDGLAEPSELSEQLLSFYSCRDKNDVLRYFTNTEPYEFAKFAPLLIQLASSGHVGTTEIISQASAFIDKLAQSVLKNQTQALSLIGGLAKPMLPFLSDKLVSRHQEPLSCPTKGAILYLKQWAKTNQP